MQEDRDYFDDYHGCYRKVTHCASYFFFLQEDRDYLSRLLPIGHELCILPKTCLNTFGDKQPVYELGEAFQLGHGGSWADPPQVASRPHLCL
jgi:hypothetical protein